MDKYDLYEYDLQRKVIHGVIMIGFFMLAGVLFATYIFYFRQFGLLQGTFIETIMIFFKDQIANYTFLGLFIAAMVGGLFFIPLPMEIIFATFLVKNPATATVFFVYMAGLTLGYSFDLFIGYKFSTFARNLISTKKFYKMKTWINNYGKFAVFLSCVTPLPSQQVSFIVGVFKYNKYKFLTQFLAGQTIKLLAIIGLVFIFKVSI
ncbi:hypothetical protein GOV08_02200 [Candidatus Woesearchaeota archaeon]|nr:hypothetical protein [Candidatus Woesearchaeota archaeon]